MAFQEQLENLVVSLFDINAVKFGEFLTKSGIKTPIYFDLRVIVSYPKVMELTSTLLYEFNVKNNECELICGVPYTALPIATVLSIKANKPMLLRRKEAKGYGTKKIIEGHYKEHQSCLIIEDVITSGSSIIETVQELAKEKLVVNEAVIILDREQGGKENLEKNGIQVKSLLTMTSLIEILLKNDKISSKTADVVRKYIKDVKSPVNITETSRLTIPYEKRAELAKNCIAKKLFNIMATKKTNLCVAADLTSTVDILNLLDKVGPHVCLVKTHVDIIENFDEDFVKRLKEIAVRFNFLILEDRKFADIGNTVATQFSIGVYKIRDWADCVTVHSVAGAGVLKALGAAGEGRDVGLFLLAEMSSEGNLITPEYSAETVSMAAKYPEITTGFVCQNSKTFTDPGCIQLTPGVQIGSSGDDFGQTYNSPKHVILTGGADIAVVGRGIVKADNPEFEAVRYKEALWKCYEERTRVSAPLVLLRDTVIR